MEVRPEETKKERVRVPAPRSRSRPRLVEASPVGKAAQFLGEDPADTGATAGSGATVDSGASVGSATFFLSFQGSAADHGELCEGDLLAVSAETDAEPGDLVVWWAGTEASQALARVAEDLSLEPVAGFPAPPIPGAQSCRHKLSIRGVVVGRLRRME